MLEHSILDPHFTTEWKAFAIPWLAKQLRVGGIREQGHPRVHNFVTGLRTTTLLGKCRTSFVGTARVEGKGEQLNQIAHGLRFEDHCIASRFHGHRVARRARLFDGRVAHRFEVDLLPIRMIGSRPTGTGAVIGTNSELIVGARCGEVGVHPGVRRDRIVAATCNDEAGRREITRGL